MSKVYESDVDPDEFIRSFREESSQSTVKKENENKAETPASPSDSKRRKVQSQPLPEEDEYLDFCKEYGTHAPFMQISYG